MFKILLILLTLNTFAKTIYHKDRHFNKAYQTARAIKDHPIQRQALTVLEQIYKNLDVAEYQRMRSALTTLSDPRRYDSHHETVYLFKEAIEKIPGVKITTDFTILSEASIKIRRGRNSEPPIFLGSKKEIQDFHVASRGIDFELDNKIYSITPSLFGRTSFTLRSVDATKSNEARANMRFEETGNDDKEIKKRYNAWQKTMKTEYRVGYRKRKIDNNTVTYTLKADYDYRTNTGNPSLSADKLSLSAFAASVKHHRDIMPLAWYINGSRHEPQYTDEQKARVKEIEDVPNFLSSQSATQTTPQQSQGAN